jgi:hypothetical protein
MNTNYISTELSRIKTPEAMKEIMYHEILKKAEKADEKKKSRIVVLMIPAVAALLLAVIFIPQIMNNNPRTPSEIPGSIDSSGYPSASSTYWSTTQTQSKPIITGINGAENQVAPQPGEVIITPTLEEKMKQYGPDDVLFHVKIDLYFDITNAFKYEGKTMDEHMDEYRNNPAYVLYNEEHEKWWEEVYLPLDKEMTAAEERGEDYAQGWWKHDPDQLFEEYWNENQSQDVKTAYELASELYNEAHIAYEEWRRSTDGAYARELEFVNAECNRLNSSGYDLEVNLDNSFMIMELTGYLTRYQIDEFSPNESCGYTIMWADGENVMNH